MLLKDNISTADGMLRGVHFACREKLCTFVNAERDGCITGHGVVHLEGYAFAHRVWVQIPPLLKVLRPTGLAATIGFPKRFAIGVHESAPLDPDQQCRTSKQFLYDFFNWMGKNATSTPRRTYYDKFALIMHMKILEGVRDFVQEVDAVPQADAPDTDRELFHQKL